MSKMVNKFKNPEKSQKVTFLDLKKKNAEKKMLSS
jgi:hypothetical protein